MDGLFSLIYTRNDFLTERDEWVTRKLHLQATMRSDLGSTD
jgi:hypothetical protein